MNKELAIKVTSLSKVYKLYNNPVDRLKESIHPFRKKYSRDFFALKDLSFEVEKGSTVGIIGKNGSGKSTLLKILTGVLTQTTGVVSIQGKVSALLELGTGFNPEMTGIENIYFSGTIMGYSKQEMDEKIDDILTFADIGDFVHQPVKIYSSGMFVRLAFSIATAINPEILIVDEALAVGDVFFQAKCTQRMKKMVDKGITLLFVSHDSGSVKSLCKKCMLLNFGELLDYDTSDKVVEKYFNIKVQSEQKVIAVANPVDKSDLQKLERQSTNATALHIFTKNAEFQKRAAFQRIQNGKASFSNILLLNEHEKEIHIVEYAQTVILRMALDICENIPALGHGYHIRDKNGIDVVYSDCVIENMPFLNVKSGEKYLIDWKFKATLMHGHYTIACGTSIPLDLATGKVNFCDFVPIAVQFEMQPRHGSHLYGFVHWDNNVITLKI
jgi:lipopolysaccharide transport system ATP-binding protein